MVGNLRSAVIAAVHGPEHSWKDYRMTLMQRINSHWRQDLPASIVVLLVALPLCLGIALGSGAPAMSGLIAGVVGGIVVGLLSGSSLSVSGPAAGLTAIVVAALQVLPFEHFLLSVVLAGVFQIVLGYLRAGVIGDYVPNSVIKGMLAAIGVILILKQIPHLVGHDADYEGDETFLQPDAENTFSELLSSIPHITPLAVGIGIVCLLLIIVFESKPFKGFLLFKYIPVPLVVVIVGVLMEQFFTTPTVFLLPDQLVQLPVVSNSSELAGLLTFPDLSGLTAPAVWTTAVTLALVASLETLLSIEAVDKLDPLKRITPTDRELKAQGVGNMLSGLLGGLPVTSVIVRSSANVNAGGLTRLSAVLHGVMMLLCVVFIPGILNLIPKAALAAILIYTGYKLARVSLFKEFYARGWDQFIPFVITILAILLLDLLKGVAVGVLVGLYYVMRSNFRSAILHVQSGPHHLLRLRKEVSFLNKPLIKRTLEKIPDSAHVIIDATRADLIDQDVVDAIEDFTSHAHLRGIQVEVQHIAGKPAHRLLDRLRSKPGVIITANEEKRIPTH
jgi:MFS superfamily sulfate permease-like transporter